MVRASGCDNRAVMIGGNMCTLKVSRLGLAVETLLEPENGVKKNTFRI